jgi:hypothetical protein
MDIARVWKSKEEQDPFGSFDQYDIESESSDCVVRAGEDYRFKGSTRKDRGSSNRYVVNIGRCRSISHMEMHRG